MAWRADVLRVDYEISRIVDSERVNMGSVWRTICHGSHFCVSGTFILRSCYVAEIC